MSVFPVCFQSHSGCSSFCCSLPLISLFNQDLLFRGVDVNTADQSSSQHPSVRHFTKLLKHQRCSACHSSSFKKKEENTAGTYTHSAAKLLQGTFFDIRGVHTHLNCFSQFVFPALAHAGPHTPPPSVTAQRNRVATVVKVFECSVQGRLTVQQGWILRTLLACALSTLQPHIYSLTGDISFFFFLATRQN